MENWRVRFLMSRTGDIGDPRNFGGSDAMNEFNGMKRYFPCRFSLKIILQLHYGTEDFVKFP